MIKKDDFINNSTNEKEKINSKLSNDSNQNFFLKNDVKQCKKLTVLDVVKVLLLERGMKQVELADKIGISRQGLNNYLRGEWTPPTRIKLKIAEALGVDSSLIWCLE